MTGDAAGAAARVEPALVREHAADPDSVGEDAELVELIRGEIERDGPITFARFMQRALYEPGRGYYATRGSASVRGPAGPSREPGPVRGDFITAPEAHPIFGAAFARVLEQTWEAMRRPDRFVVTEHGGGTGALAVALLDGLRDRGSPLLDALAYRPVEVDPAAEGAVRARLVAAGHERRLVGRASRDAADTGAVIANEVLDALPVHRVVGRDGGISELLVTVTSEGFAHVEAEQTTPGLAGRLASEGVTLADGQVAEVCLALEPWLHAATVPLERGFVLLVDYGEEPAQLYRPERRTGTLRAFARHAVGGDPFRHVGRQDLTATVDLEAVRRAADAAGLEPLGETTQAELLAAAAGDLGQAGLRGSNASFVDSLADALALRSALARLLDPRGMGGYAVLAFGRGMAAGTVLPALARLAAGPRPPR